jgi:acetoin utilization protein AcuB
MIVKNWMLLQQYSISSDALATEAAMLMDKHKLKMLPVVDEGKLRGIVHRKDLSEAAMCVSGSGDASEMRYYCNKLKVKDVMVRRPTTVSVNESVEEVLLKGKKLTMSTFPVLDGDKVVGVVSDREIFVSLFKLLEAGVDRVRITLANVHLEKGTLSEILNAVDETGGKARAIFTVPQGTNDNVRVVLRAESDNPEAIRKALEEKGFNILEFSS